MLLALREEYLRDKIKIDLDRDSIGVVVVVVVVVEQMVE